MLSIFIPNSILDFISLIQTRALLKSKCKVTTKIIMDAVLTLFIVLAGFSSIVLIIFNSPDKFDYPYSHILGGFYSLIHHIDDFYLSQEKHFRPFTITTFISSFTTSIWLWLYATNVMLIRGNSVIRLLIGNLNIEKKPIRSIGVVINCKIFASAVVVVPLWFLAV